MKLVALLGLGLAFTAASAVAAPAGFQSAYRAPPPPPPPRYNPPKPTSSTSSMQPMAPAGSDRFRPYTGTSTYSNRGGVNAYPAAPKPKGYLSPYGKP